MEWPVKVTDSEMKKRMIERFCRDTDTEFPFDKSSFEAVIKRMESIGYIFEDKK